MEEKILKLFKKKPEHYLSGEQISKSLNITRSAFWKHIEKLRLYGYEFDAVPHLGYRLRKAPDKLYPFEISPILKTRIIGKDIIYHDTVGSTNTIAYNLAKSGAKEGVVVVAERQTKGRGRLSRIWSSPKEKGIYLSIILRPKMTPFKAPVMTLMAAVSLAQAIRESADVQAFIKWPNDILINEKKVSGILTEMDAEADFVKFLILGIGINANTKILDLPKGATSIAQESGVFVVRQQLVKALLERLEQNYLLIQKEGFAPIRTQWRNLSVTLGRRVKATCMHKQIEGEAVDIEPDGGLKVRLDNGFYEKVMAGDLALLR